MSEAKTDPELNAIELVIKALAALDAEARSRVISYVFQRLGLGLPTQTAIVQSSRSSESPTMAHIMKESFGDESGAVTDIRTFKDAKKPQSDNEMAAIVANYLRELAPADQRKLAISREDIEKYFVQANFPLPKRPKSTLVNAKNAGYFDALGDGTYRLNPVGHNLVVHGLSSTSPEERTRKKPRRGKRKSR
jgi:hypothetical protein